MKKYMENKKKAAIVTGASSGIGKAISIQLCNLGYEVFGFGRNFSGTEAADGIKVVDGIVAADGTEDGGETEGLGTFHKIVCDLTDTPRLCGYIKEIQQAYETEVLVNNAGCGYYGLHEELNVKKIQEMVRVNLEVPMILTQMLLRTLKKTRGYVINISSVTAEKTNPHGAAYGATKAGLTSFGKSLFDEARKYGVKVVTIQPDMTKTNLYRNADFMEGEAQNSYLLPDEIAQAVNWIMTCREGTVVSEITLQPQLHQIRKKGTAH